MNLIFCGPPGGGKGSVSKLLKDKYNFYHLSTGDLLREESKKDTELSVRIKNLIDNGNLVSDDILKQLVQNKVDSLTEVNGIIFDGYPRTLPQIKDLEEILNKKGQKIDSAFYIFIDKENSMKRSLGRQSCPNCNANYNKYTGYKTPKVPDICDNCNSKLISRADDTEESFIKRYDSYIKETSPVIEELKKKGLLITLDGKKLPEEQVQDIVNILGENNDNNKIR